MTSRGAGQRGVQRGLNAAARLAVRLYPKAWRDKYGDEMAAILEDHRVTLSTLLDLALNSARTHLFWERRGIWRTQFLVGAAAVSFACLSSYTVIQQMMRRGANEPQISIVNMLAADLSSGQSVGAVLGRGGTASSGAAALVALPVGVVDVKHSLAPFVIVYNRGGVPIASTVRLNGATPKLPAGVLANAERMGLDKVTWQPEPDARIAAVVKPYDGGFVLSGRALRVVEKDESRALNTAEVVWVTMMAAFVAVLVWLRRLRRRPGFGTGDGSG